MKTTFKVLVAMFALGFVMLVGLHLFLQYGLTQAMRGVILPRIEAETGIAVEVGGLSLNVPGGILSIKEVAIRNPVGYPLENLATIDRIHVEVDVVSLLLQKPILVHRVQMQNALVNVIRNQEGEVNLDRVQGALPPKGNVAASEEPGQQQPEKPASEKLEPLPEMLIRSLLCNARVRYLDMNYEDLDLIFDVSMVGKGLSTQPTPNARWGTLAVTGALGSDRSRFQTDLNMNLAPLTDLQAPSFDLTGKVMEIDPRMMDKIYSSMGIRSAPFSIDPVIHCRGGAFKDSSLALELRQVTFEDKLAARLGGMAMIGSLRLVLPLGGTIQQPKIDFSSSFTAALGHNVGSMFEALLKGTAAKEAGLETPPQDLAAAAVEVLGKHVEEIGKSETAKKILKDLAGGAPSATNAPSKITVDDLVNLLDEQLDEVEDGEEIKQGLKLLEKAIFGK